MLMPLIPGTQQKYSIEEAWPLVHATSWKRSKSAFKSLEFFEQAKDTDFKLLSLLSVSKHCPKYFHMTQKPHFSHWRQKTCEHRSKHTRGNNQPSQIYPLLQRKDGLPELFREQLKYLFFV